MISLPHCKNHHPSYSLPLAILAYIDLNPGIMNRIQQIMFGIRRVESVWLCLTSTPAVQLIRSRTVTALYQGTDLSVYFLYHHTLLQP